MSLDWFLQISNSVDIYAEPFRDWSRRRKPRLSWTTEGLQGNRSCYVIGILSDLGRAPSSKVDAPNTTPGWSVVLGINQASVFQLLDFSQLNVNLTTGAL